MPDSEPQCPLTYGQLIRGSTAFRYLWAGQIVSLLGDWFNLITSASLIARLRPVCRATLSTLDQLAAAMELGRRSRQSGPSRSEPLA